MYSIRDNADAGNLGESKFGNGGDLMITTDPFMSTGTFTVRLKATSFSGAACVSSSTATVLVSGVLPLTLTDFSGKVADAINKLSWTTSSEQNMNGFDIERSYNGHDYTTIGNVAAVGNSSVIQQYHFDDMNPGSRITYYRLKIIDQSRTSYSRVVMLRTDKGISISQLGPNPFTDNIQINLDVARNTGMSVSLKDMSGRTLVSTSFDARKGANSFTLQGLQKFSAGTYIIELFTENERIEKRILIKK